MASVQCGGRNREAAQRTRSAPSYFPQQGNKHDAMFKKLFGGSKEQAASAPIPPPTVKAATQTINSIQQLQDQEESLEKRKALIEKKIEGELQKARELNKAGKKQQALMCLKRKKLLETEMQNLDNMAIRITEQRMMLEGQRVTVSAWVSYVLLHEENLCRDSLYLY